MLSQRALEAFHATMITGSVSGAADMLHVSQPAVSRLIRDLEQAVGMALFLRMGGRVVPTAEAQELSAEVERAFIGLSTIEQAAAEIRRGHRSLISIAAMPALSQSVLPDVLAALHSERPDVQIELLPMRTQNVIRHVSVRQCQIGFTAPTRQQFDIDLLRSYQLPYRCIMPKNHELATLKEIALADLDERNFVAFTATAATGQMLDRAFASRRKPPRITARSHLSTIVAALVLRGMGVGIVDPFTAADMVAAGGISRPVTFMDDFAIAAIRPLGQKLTPELETILACFEAAVLRASS